MAMECEISLVHLGAVMFGCILIGYLVGFLIHSR